ncbi:hypothetical protein [Blastococcus sp. CT_GayMR16]|uniref:hypothetical protein n=1 Tax=Blastococcus sp. CT_GayMR16 TaxID=2559607 RepID=UPI001073121D|nr:hypothetical protein [Blastococcus sp. CT_GayMR16]TFV89631.1 hypothetical protein E4P38_07695 [Blastococcus sp. CT_GayMR16]
MTGSRIAAPLLGGGGVVLLVVGNELTKVGGDSPSLHAPAAEYATAIGSSGLVVVGVYGVVAAWLALGAFFSVVGERLRERPDGGRPARLVAAGGALAAAVGISGAAPLLAATVMVGDGGLSPETAKSLLLLNGAVFVLGWLVVSVPLGVAAAAGRRLGVLGRGTGRVGTVVAVALAAGSLAVWFAEGALLVWLVALIWIVVASVSVSRRAGRPAILTTVGCL